VSKSEHALEHVPEHYLSGDLLKKALRKNGLSLYYVPTPAKRLTCA
jgi:hypothetical protein